MAKKIFLSTLLSAIIMSVIFLVHLFLTFSAIYGIVFIILLAIYLGFLLFISKKKDETFLQPLIFLHLTAFSIFLGLTFFNMTILLLVIIIMSIAFFFVKMFSFRDVLKTLFMFIVIFIASTTLFQPAVAISAGQGTVLSDNWWNSLNWIRNNTAECAVIATYWDPGHFITGIAKRPVVFDGASQNALWNTTVEGDLSQEQLRGIAGTDKFRTIQLSDGRTLLETARIQDIATTLATNNETMAIDILEKYRKSGCNEMYYLATADLIGKSFWWTYFSSWNPIDKGCATPMSQLGLKQVRPSTTGSISYTYEGGIPAGCNQQVGGQVIITQQNNTLTAFVFRGTQLEQVESFIYFTEQSGILRTQPNAPVKGLIYLEPNRQSVIFVPEQIQDSMFTKMFLFNGEGLNNFEYVDTWGGEVKLFRVKFNTTG